MSGGVPIICCVYFRKFLREPSFTNMLLEVWLRDKVVDDSNTEGFEVGFDCIWGGRCPLVRNRVSIDIVSYAIWSSKCCQNCTGFEKVANDVVKSSEGGVCFGNCGIDKI